MKREKDITRWTFLIALAVILDVVWLTMFLSRIEDKGDPNVWGAIMVAFGLGLCVMALMALRTCDTSG